jgi:hypothetical protein
MRCRLIAIAAIVLALALPGATGASSGPKRVQALAAAQTVYLFAHLTGVQSASPKVCGAGQPSSGFLGFFLLPTLSFSPGDQRFDCRITTRTVVLDLSGSTVTEDANADEPYVFEDGTELLFLPRNLERICDDVGPRFFPKPSPATLDGKPIAGTAVTTPAFPVPIHRTAPLTFWEDSVKRGHPGVLASTFCGWKAVLTLTRGEHVILVDHTRLFEESDPPTRFRYDITVG